MKHFNFASMEPHTCIMIRAADKAAFKSLEVNNYAAKEH